MYSSLTIVVPSHINNNVEPAVQNYKVTRLSDFTLKVSQGWLGRTKTASDLRCHHICWPVSGCCYVCLLPKPQQCWRRAGPFPLRQPRQCSVIVRFLAMIVQCYHMLEWSYISKGIKTLTCYKSVQKKTFLYTRSTGHVVGEYRNWSLKRGLIKILLCFKILSKILAVYPEFFETGLPDLET